LAGIGGHVSGMIESTKAGKMLIAIDGCPVSCAKKTLEHAGFQIQEHVQTTDLLGIEKHHQFNLDAADVRRVSDHITSLVSKEEACSNIHSVYNPEWLLLDITGSNQNLKNFDV